MLTNCINIHRDRLKTFKSTERPGRCHFKVPFCHLQRVVPVKVVPCSLEKGNYYAHLLTERQSKVMQTVCEENAANPVGSCFQVKRLLERITWIHQGEIMPVQYDCLLH